MFADGNTSRVTFNGPDLMLPEQLAIPIGMAIHELATNAVKYGALSVLGRTLVVQWNQSETDIEINWQERGVPMRLKKNRVGFGTRLLKEILPKQIGAAFDIRYGSDGVNARLIISGKRNAAVQTAAVIELERPESQRRSFLGYPVRLFLPAGKTPAAATASWSLGIS